MEAVILVLWALALSVCLSVGLADFMLVYQSICLSVSLLYIPNSSVICKVIKFASWCSFILFKLFEIAKKYALKTNKLPKKIMSTCRTATSSKQ